MEKPAEQTIDATRLKEKEIPPEYRYHLGPFTSTPDRYGSVGRINFYVDWRPKKISFSYVELPLQEGLRFFADDHHRSLNAQFGEGGRDMRELKITDKEIRKEREQQMEMLYQRAKELRKELESRLGFPRVILMRTTTRETRSEYNEKHDESFGYSVNIPTLRWIETDMNHLHDETEVAREKFPGFANKRFEEFENSPEYAAGLSAGNRVATHYLRQRILDLEQATESQEIIRLRNELDETLKKLAVFEGECSVQIPLYLAPKDEKDERATILPPNLVPRYTPRNPFGDGLHQLGAVHVKKYYEMLDVDLQDETIDFSPTIGHEHDSMIALADLRNRHKSSSDNDAKQKGSETTTQQVKIDNTKNRERIKAEMTPEIKRGIADALHEAEALVKILVSLPAMTPEQKKFVAGVPRGAVSQLRSDFEHTRKGIELVDEIKKVKDILMQYADRKKINEEMPGLKKKAMALLDQWRSIPGLIASDETAQMVLEEKIVSETQLSDTIASTFLKNPWEHKAADILAKEVEKLVEELG